MKTKQVSKLFKIFRLPRLKPIAITAIWSVVLAVLFAFAHDKQSQRTIKDVSIVVQNQEDNYFLDSKDIEALATLQNKDNLKAKRVAETYSRLIEQRLLVTQYIDRANVYRDLSGQLHIQAQLCVPIARLLTENGQDKYITTKGNVIPWSKKFTPRTFLITGSFASTFRHVNWIQDSLLYPYFQLLSCIHKDPLFHTLLVGAEIKSSGYIILYPQIGRQKFIFGPPTLIDTKLRKIHTFYKKIIPLKGWNAYTDINLSFDNQIVCTKYPLYNMSK